MALKPFNSVGGFSVGEIPANVIDSSKNFIGNNANFSGNLFISNATASWGVLTDNLYYSNGVPWDFQQAAGANTQIQYNQNNDFGASANFTYNDASQLLTVIGNIQVNNANLGNLGYANYINVASNVITGNLTVNNSITGNTANFSGNVVLPNLTVNLELSGNTANFSGNINSALNANLGNLVKANYINVASNLITSNATINLELAGNTANFSGNVIVPNLTVNLELAGNTANFTGNTRSNNLTVNNVITGNTANFSGNIIVPNLTVNLELAGNTANFTTSVQTPLLKNGNSNIAIAANGNITVASAGTNVITVFGNAANTPNNEVVIVGNIKPTGIWTDGYYYANGAVVDFEQPAGANTYIQYNDNGDFGASPNFAFDFANNELELNGNVLLGGTQQNQIVNNSNTALEIRGGWNNAASTAVNIVAGDYANATNWGKIAILGNYSGNAVGFSEANAFVFTNPGYGSGNVVKIDILNPAATSTTTGVIQANGGIGVTGNAYIGGNANITGNLSVTGDIANANNISVTNTLNAVTGNFSGNINSLNANLGNLAQANFVNVASNTITNNLTVNLSLVGNTANFSGNVIANNLTVNLELSGNTANFTGNVVAANFVGDLANGNSNVKVYSNSNVEISIGGVANIATFVGNRLQVVGNINSTAGNIIANGNVIANGTVVGANANISGQAAAGSVLTPNITATTGNITISASGIDSSILLVPTGVGSVDVANFKITQVGDPTNPHDAATKEYVDNIAQGLSVHPAVRVTSTTNLNATYADGGTALTTTTITGGKTIQFSANHGLSVGDEIYWTNTFNGITSNDAYFVYSTPALNQITVKNGFYGVEVTTLTNATGLTQPARGNPGVGATLTNAGANAAISIDSIALALNDRVLVQGQTLGAQNGVYVVSTVGSGAAAWVLTRATNEDQYDPKSTSGLAYGDYFFVQQGTNSAGSSYILTTPAGEIVFGVTSIGFTQFSASGAYTAGNGINITGTIISANVDNDTTAIVAGNIAVKTNANFITPNLGDATFSSLSWNTLSNGNVTANNLSISNIANISGNLTVTANVQVSYDIDSNANIYSNNSDVTNFLTVGANITGNNITSNHLITTTNANISSNLITSNATVNLELVGNTANFSGNVIVPNLTVNLALVGNTANFSGNLTAANANLGNLVTANYVNVASNVTTSNLTVNLQLSGNTANFSGNIVTLNANLGNLATANYFTGEFVNGNSNIRIAANGNVSISANGAGNVFTVSEAGANITGNLGVSGNFSVGNLSANTLSANTSVEIGDTTITWGNVTTTSITANQTISTYAVSGVTGIEWFVRGVDSSGTKYSVAKVQAVTDGANVDYTVYGGVSLGGQTGTLAVNIGSGNINLQVTPASSNSTVWVTQYRII